MAKAFIPLILLFIFFVTAQRAAGFGFGFGGKVGGRTPVINVESNQAIQELGGYSVQEYNRQLEVVGNGNLLAFTRVVAAETHVVSGMKYYLKISAATSIGVRNFDAEVVVKPWLRSMDLVFFAPSPISTFN